MAYSPAQLAAFNARLKIGLSRATKPETPVFRDIRRGRMMADYRAPETEETPDIIAPARLAPSQLEKIVEYHQAQLNFLTNKVMEKRVEKKNRQGEY